MPIFGKPFKLLDLDDIKRLITEQVPEDNGIEYKEELPANKVTDPWIQGENKIGEKARNEILEEIVAFSNGHGGMLFLGISESDMGDGVAAGFKPIPKV